MWGTGELTVIELFGRRGRVDVGLDALDFFLRVSLERGVADGAEH